MNRIDRSRQTPLFAGKPNKKGTKGRTTADILAEIRRTPKTDTYRLADPEASASHNPEINQRIEDMHQGVAKKRDQEAYVYLQNHVTFPYGNEILSGLYILNILYKRDTEGSEKDLTTDFFNHFSQEPYDRQQRLYGVISTLTQRGLLKESTGKAKDYDIRRKNTSKPYRKLTVTSLGKSIVEQYHADLAAGHPAVKPPPPVAKAKEELPKPSPSKSQQLLKLLLEPSDWGASGITILKALQKQISQRSWLLRTAEFLTKAPFEINCFTGIHQNKLLQEFPLSAENPEGPLVQLEKAGLISWEKNRLLLTNLGEQISSEENLWDTELIAADDLKALAQERVDACRDALKELRSLMSDFEEAYDKAKTEYTKAHTEIETLTTQAREAFTQSKDLSLEEAIREEHLQRAIRLKEEAKKLENALQEDQKWHLDHATFQLNRAQAIEEIVEANINARYRKVSQDQVMLKLAIFQNNLAEFVSHWGQDTPQMEDPIQSFHKALQQEGSDLSDNINNSASMLEVKKRVEARLQKHREALVRDELEADLKASTPAANDKPEAAPIIAETTPPPSAVESAISQAATNPLATESSSKDTG